MADPLIEIPDRPAFKAAEVCEIAHIPPYVLRSWEKEFPNLGVVPKTGAPRVYRRGDVEQILRIKQLVFSEGLTLAGARRRLEGEPPPEPEPELPIPDEVKARVGRIKQELRSLLQLLGPEGDPGTRSGSRLESAASTPPGPRAVPPAPAPVPTPASSGAWPPPRRAADASPDEEPALPLLDAEAETATPPPAAAVPASRKRRKKG